MTLSHYACLVPSRYMDRPKSTIGLGDTFAAGVQLAFIRRSDSRGESGHSPVQPL